MAKATKEVEIEQKYRDGYVSFRLTNVKVWWAHLQRTDTAFGNNKWCMEMHLDDDVAKELKDIGFNIVDKTDKEGNVIKSIFKAKKEKVTKAGKEQEKPLVYLADGITVTNDDVGNGSVCNVMLQAKAWPIRGKWQLGAYIDKVQVVKLVPYDKGGFTDVTEDIPF